MDPITLSLTVGLSATALSLPAAIAVAWYLERTRLWGRSLVHVLVMMPLVLPPVVLGYLLLKLFSPRGAVGRALEFLGMPVAFHWMGAVIAAAVVGFPLFVMLIGLSMKGVDSRLESVSRSLGRSPWETFRRVTLPLSWQGILAGAVISFARGLGEFGATIVLAGRIPGETETIPLSIYAELDSPGGQERIIGLVAASIVICLVSVLLFRVLYRCHRKRLELDR